VDKDIPVRLNREHVCDFTLRDDPMPRLTFSKRWELGVAIWSIGRVLGVMQNEREENVIEGLRELGLLVAFARAKEFSRYAQHLRTCATRQVNETPAKCDCGLEELL
jgi:hypothetical protein